jgi:hypothetical protein
MSIADRRLRIETGQTLINPQSEIPNPKSPKPSLTVGLLLLKAQANMWSNFHGAATFACARREFGG